MYVRQQRLIVGNSYVEADLPELGGATANNWTSGKIQVFKEDLTVLTAADAATYQGPIFVGQYEAVTTGLLPEEQVTVDSTKLVGPIAKEAIRAGSYKYCAYVAPVNQAASFPIPATADISEGLTYTFYVRQTNDHENTYEVKDYHEVKATSSDDQDSIGNCLADSVNAHKSSSVTAAYAAGVLTLTAKQPRIYFALGLRKDLAGTVITDISANDGVGSYAEVFAIEDIHERGNLGNFNRVEYVAEPGFASSVDKAGNYDLFIIETGDELQSDGISKSLKAPKALTVAIDSLGTGNTDLQTLLELWLDLPIDNKQD